MNNTTCSCDSNGRQPVFGSADPVAFTFAVVAIILASFTLLDRAAQAMRKGAILSIIRGLRLLFPAEGVDAIHLHSQIWNSAYLPDQLISDDRLMRLMVKHPSKWAIGVDVQKANIGFTDYVNLAGSRFFKDFDGNTTRVLDSISEVEYRNGIDLWFLKLMAASSDSSQEEQDFYEQLAYLRCLKWNRDVDTKTHCTAWEVPKNRRFTTLWLLLAVKDIFGANDVEGTYHRDGLTIRIEKIGMTHHLYFTERRLGTWTSYRVWDLQAQEWKSAHVTEETTRRPALKCKSLGPTPTFNLGVETDRSVLFFICPQDDVVKNLGDLITSLTPSKRLTLPYTWTIQRHWLALTADIHTLDPNGTKSWCRCGSPSKASSGHICCLPICTVVLDGEKAGDITILPSQASLEVFYVMLAGDEDACFKKLLRNTPCAKQSDKSLITSMLLYEGRVLISSFQ